MYLISKERISFSLDLLSNSVSFKLISISFVLGIFKKSNVLRGFSSFIVNFV